MRIIKIITLLFVCTLFSNNVYSQNDLLKSYLTKTDTLLLNNEKISIPRRVFIPDHNRLQFAGAIGFLSIGAGYNIGKRYEITFMLGLQNKTLGNSNEAIVTTAIKNTINLYHPIIIKKRLSFIPTVGLSVNWGYTNNTFNKLPSHYPESYYFQNKIHIAPFIGGKLRIECNERNSHRRAIELYAELGSIDAYILECIRTDYVGLNDILNLAIGISVYFE